MIIVCMNSQSELSEVQLKMTFYPASSLAQDANKHLSFGMISIVETKYVNNGVLSSNCQILWFCATV